MIEATAYEVYRCFITLFDNLHRIYDVRENQGESGNFEVLFENQGKWTFLEKIRENSWNFILNDDNDMIYSANIYEVIFSDTVTI